MIMTNTPSSNEELQYLQPVIPIIYQAIDLATEAACAFFEQHSKPNNSALYPDLVRYYAGEELRDKGQVVEDFTRQPMGRNGLCIVFKGRRIRIWKADEDELPAPGTSSVKNGFLNQQLSWDMGAISEPVLIERNLAILWNVDSRRRLRRLYLVLPKATKNTWSPAEQYWSIEIPNPFLSDIPQSDAPKSKDPEAGTKDLPFGLPDVEDEADSATDLE